MKAVSIFNKFILILFLISASIFVPKALGKSTAGPWYIAPGGSDSEDCPSSRTPCATIHGAVSKASSGSTNFVAQVVYRSASHTVMTLDKNHTLSGGWKPDFASQASLSTLDGQSLRRGMIIENNVIATGEPHFVNSTSYLPVVFKPCPPLYFDDFSDSGSGWPAGDDGKIRLEYLDAKYRFLIRPTRWGAIARPGFQASDYKLSVDVSNPTGVMGSYGIAFGIAQDWSTFYTLEIFPDGWYGIYRYDPTTFAALSEAFSPAIYQGSAANQVRVERSGASINAYANGQLLASVNDGSYTGTRSIGLVVFSYDQPNVDIRFDNFSVDPIGCGGLNSPLTLNPVDGGLMSLEGRK